MSDVTNAAHFGDLDSLFVARIERETEHAAVTAAHDAWIAARAALASQDPTRWEQVRAALEDAGETCP